MKPIRFRADRNTWTGVFSPVCFVLGRMDARIFHVSPLHELTWSKRWRFVYLFLLSAATPTMVACSNWGERDVLYSRPLPLWSTIMVLYLFHKSTRPSHGGSFYQWDKRVFGQSRNWSRRALPSQTWPVNFTGCETFL